MNTKKGFYGEIIAGLLTEIYQPHRVPWLIPAFCFYAHDVLFQELIRTAKQDTLPRRAIGHFGDDCLAFEIANDSPEISRILICEAKCTGGHDASMIRAAHAKLGKQPIECTTVWIQNIIEALRTRDDAESNKWIDYLAAFKDSPRFVESNRDDLVSYTHGRRPANPNATWISNTTAHADYTATRRLDVFEVHFTDVETLIDQVYEAAYP